MLGGEICVRTHAGQGEGGTPSYVFRNQAYNEIVLFAGNCGRLALAVAAGSMPWSPSPSGAWLAAW